MIRSYDDKDGNKRKATEVVIDNMQMLGSPRDRAPAGSDDGGAGYNGGGAAAPAHASSAGEAFGDELEDEIPF